MWTYHLQDTAASQWPLHWISFLANVTDWGSVSIITLSCSFTSQIYILWFHYRTIMVCCKWQAPSLPISAHCLDHFELVSLICVKITFLCPISSQEKIELSSRWLRIQGNSVVAFIMLHVSLGSKNIQGRYLLDLTPFGGDSTADVWWHLCMLVEYREARTFYKAADLPRQKDNPTICLSVSSKLVTLFAHSR